MLGDTFGKVKKESNKTLWIGIAALVLISVVGGTLFLMMHSSNEENAAKAQQQQQILLNMANTVKQPQALDPTVKARIDQMSSEMAKLMQQNRELIAAKSSAPAGGQTQPHAQRPAQGSSGEGYDEAFAKASNEYSSGHPDAAYSDSYALISADGNRYEAYYLAALCLSSMNRPADAIPVYEFALQNAPDSVKSSIAQKLADARTAASQRGGAAQSQE